MDAILKPLKDELSKQRDQSTPLNQEGLVSLLKNEFRDPDSVAAINTIKTVLDNTWSFIKAIDDGADSQLILSAISQVQTYLQVTQPLVDKLSAVMQEVPPNSLTNYKKSRDNLAVQATTFLSQLIAVPEAPINIIATPSIGEVTVSWSAPSQGGSPINSYVISYDENGKTKEVTVWGGETNAAVSGLKPGASYTFKVAARNFAGLGPSATATSVIHKQGSRVPDPPIIIDITPDVGQATVVWNPPADDGGSTITSYTVKCNGSSKTLLVKDIGRITPYQYTVKPLTAGQIYTVSIWATNDVDTSQPDEMQVTIPKAPPAPTIDSITFDGDQIVVIWEQPGDGGSPITGYTITAKWFGGADIVKTISAAEAGSAPPYRGTISGLKAGQTYSITVAATNAVGKGADSESFPLKSLSPSTVETHLTTILQQLQNQPRLSEDQINSYLDQLAPLVADVSWSTIGATDDPSRKADVATLIRINQSLEQIYAKLGQTLTSDRTLDRVIG